MRNLSIVRSYLGPFHIPTFLLCVYTIICLSSLTLFTPAYMLVSTLSFVTLVMCLCPKTKVTDSCETGIYIVFCLTHPIPPPPLPLPPPPPPSPSSSSSSSSPSPSRLLVWLLERLSPKAGLDVPECQSPLFLLLSPGL